MPAANDDLVASRMWQPVGYGRWVLNGLINLDNDGADGTALTASTKRLGTCKKKPVRALIQAEDQPIRWTDDPEFDPTATATNKYGGVIAAGQTLEYDGDLSKFRMIQGAAGAIAHVFFYAA